MSDVLTDSSEQVQVRLEKLKQIQGRGEVAYKNGFSPTSNAQIIHKNFAEKSKEDLEAHPIPVSVAGRIMAIRDMGKSSFVHLQDGSGKIQLYLKKDQLGEESYQKFKELDLGDIVFAQGQLFRTKTGELSVSTSRVDLLTKSLRPLPEKYHGLTDVEIRYRQRYLDLIMSEEVKETFRVRSRVIEEIRSYLTQKGFLEVETPMMHSVVGGATARPFTTHHNTLDMKLYLRIAPELYLKRLIVGGFDRVFEINRNFRNEGISIKHNPEFTMLEFYMAYATYEDLMDLTEDLFQTLCDKVLGKKTITYQGTEIQLETPWPRITVEDAVLKYSDFKDRSKLRDKEALLAYGKDKKFSMNPKDPIGKLIMVVFDEEVEQHLIQPTFVTQYPLDVSPLSRKNENDPFLVDRFEFYIYGREIGNAFSELNDPIDQRERFLAQVDAKAKGDHEACDMDEDYVTALEYGMPPTAGQGIGIDRLVMLFTDSASIRDVILFPLLRKHD